MSDIIYTYNNKVYANITNKCNCRCVFCIRKNQDTVGESGVLWHDGDPTLEEIKEAVDQFDFTPYKELVYCGYGEPTCALDQLLETARYVKQHNDISIRLNTNGLANLYHGKNIVPLLAESVDTVSVSLNAPDPVRYQEVTQPFHPDAFEHLLKFIAECRQHIPSVICTVVDVLSPEDIAASQQIADSLGVTLRVRKYGS